MFYYLRIRNIFRSMNINALYMNRNNSSYINNLRSKRSVNNDKMSVRKKFIIKLLYYNYLLELSINITYWENALKY